MIVLLWINFFGSVSPLLGRKILVYANILRKQRNITVLTYIPIRCLQRNIGRLFDNAVDEPLQDVYLELENHYQLKFLEIKQIKIMCIF